MITKSTMNQLNDLSGNTQLRQFGRVPQRPQIQKQAPVNMRFYIEKTGDQFPLNSNGAVQFLQKCRFPTTQRNVDWVLDRLISTPVMEAVDLNGIQCGIAFEMASDPGNARLSDLGITKASLVRPMSMMPDQHQCGNPYGNQDYDEYDTMFQPPAYGGQIKKETVVAYGIDTGIPDGQGVDFGKPTMEIFNNRLVKYSKEMEARRKMI